MQKARNTPKNKQVPGAVEHTCHAVHFGFSIKRGENGFPKFFGIR